MGCTSQAETKHSIFLVCGRPRSGVCLMYQHNRQAATELGEVPIGYLCCLLHSVKCWASPREDCFCRPILLPYLLMLTNTPGLTCWRGGPRILSSPGRMLTTVKSWYLLLPFQRTPPSWVPWEDDARWSLLLPNPILTCGLWCHLLQEAFHGLLQGRVTCSVLFHFTNRIFFLFGICGIKTCKSVSSQLLCSFKVRSISHSSFVPPASGTC